MRDDDKLKFTFTVDHADAGLLIIAALRLNATIDQCVWEQMIPFHKNKPQEVAQGQFYEVAMQPLPLGKKRRGRPPGAVKKHYSERSNGPSLQACLARLKEAGDKGVEWNELKTIYNKHGAIPQGIHSALRALGTKKGNRVFLRPDATIHGKAVG